MSTAFIIYLSASLGFTLGFIVAACFGTRDDRGELEAERSEAEPQRRSRPISSRRE